MPETLYSFTCEHCGVEFTVSSRHFQWITGRGKRSRRFCSSACLGESRRGLPMPPTAERAYDACTVCDKPYEQTRLAAYCSRPCQIRCWRRRRVEAAAARTAAAAEERARAAATLRVARSGLRWDVDLGEVPALTVALAALREAGERYDEAEQRLRRARQHR